MTDILMPALSPTMEEGTLAKWNIKPGDTVKSGDVIAEIETDKATMEVEAVDEGVVGEILVPAGTEGVKVNAVIATLNGEGETSAKAAPKDGPKQEAKAQTAKAPAPSPAKVQETKVPPSKPADTPTGERVFATPLARRIASQKGLDLKAVKGSGPHGRIVKADVENASPSAAKPAAEHRPVLSLEQMGITPGSYDLIPLDGMKKTIARRMTDSFRDIPHFPLTIDLEIDGLLTARAKINAALEKRGVKVSVNDLVIKAVALALKIVPEANASYTPEGIAMHHKADVAVAVAIDGGLITPIVRSAEDRSLADIATAMKDLAERARTRKLKPEEFQGGTFSISNLGMMGIKSFASIINEPQGCILSVGAGEKRAVVHSSKDEGDALVVATVMTVTLTCDHRVVDGAIGARFLQAFKGLIEEPITMLA